jgi:hypothetical protein
MPAEPAPMGKSMRAEAESTVEAIRQALSLLRRHL